MANKQNFKPDEWTKILESTMLAGMAVSAAEPSGLWGALKEAFASSSALAAAKSESDLTNSSRPSSRISRRRKGAPLFRKRCVSISPEPSLLTLFSVRSLICERCQPSSMRRRRKTRPGSKLGCRPSARTWQRPLRRAVSSASEASKSAILKKPRSLTYQRRLERGPKSGLVASHAIWGSPAILLGSPRAEAAAARAQAAVLRRSSASTTLRSAKMVKHLQGSVLNVWLVAEFFSRRV